MYLKPYKISALLFTFFADYYSNHPNTNLYHQYNSTSITFVPSKSIAIPFNPTSSTVKNKLITSTKNKNKYGASGQRCHTLWEI